MHKTHSTDIQNRIFKSARLFVAACIGLVLVGCSGVHLPLKRPKLRLPKFKKKPPIVKTISTRPLSFVVMGDGPYSQPDYAMFDAAVHKTKSIKAPFVVHVGDYKGGGAECTPGHDATFSLLIKKLAPLPVFYTPGDNEWVDCDRFKHKDTGKRYSELARLEYIRNTYFKNPPENAKKYGYQNQPMQVENAYWRNEDIDFITLHVTGTNNARNWVGGDPLDVAQAQVRKRDWANLHWLKRAFKRAKDDKARALVVIMQADMTDVDPQVLGRHCTGVSADGHNPCDGFTEIRETLAREAKAFARPVLLIHGDTAPFTLNREIADDEAPNLWRLNVAGDSGIGRDGQPYGTRDVTYVTIQPENTSPFTATGLLSHKKPKAN